MNLGLASLFAISTGLIDTNDNIIKLSSGGGGIGGDPGGTTPAIQAKGPYVGAAGIARKIKSIYVGVNGTARKVRAAYVGVDGAARKFYRTEPLAEVPYGTTPRNLALTVLGREVAAPSDVSSIIDAVSNTIKNGKINNLVVGDYFGLASINISAGNLAGGAFSASLADVPGGHGRNLDFVLVAKEPYYQKNRNLAHHVVFQSRNVLSAMTNYYTGGHYMNNSSTNSNGYYSSYGRAFVSNRVKLALAASGVPVGEPTKIIPLRRYSNRGTSISQIEDSVFLPTEYEVFGRNQYSNPTYEAISSQTYFGYYTTAERRIKYAPSGLAVTWWEASLTNGNTTSFCAVDNYGAAKGPTYTATYTCGIAPAFAIGYGSNGSGGGTSG